MARNNRLIVDIGMSEGNDTAFYLAKGFDVVGVEADPMLAEPLRQRFAEPLAAGRLRLLERAAAARAGEAVSFWHDTAEQGHSSLLPRGGAGAGVETTVTTIDWAELEAIAGVPYFLKIDIEGGEAAFLSSMVGAAALPAFISAEVQSFRPIELFRDMGYRHFRLINQAIWAGIRLPDPPREGGFVPRPSPQHWSGAFGRELPGKRWFNYNEIKAIYDTVHRLWEFGTLITGWMDCHACLPEVAE